MAIGRYNGGAAATVVLWRASDLQSLWRIIRVKQNNDVKQLWVGLAMIAGAIIWFVVGLFFNVIFFYPAFLVIAGIVAVVRGFIALGSQPKQPVLPPGMYMGPQPGYPSQQPTYPGQQMGYPPQQPMYPGQQPGYPPQMATGYPSQQPGYPSQQMGGYGSYAPPSYGGQQMPYGAPASQSQQMFGNSKPCWNCGQPVVGNPATCPSCGAPQSTPTA
jgi:hypothetical protein